MKVSVDMTGRVPYIETAGFTYYLSQFYSMYYVGLVYSSTISPRVAVTQSFGTLAIATTHILYDDNGGGNIRLGCMHSNVAGLSQQYSDSIYILI